MYAFGFSGKIRVVWQSGFARLCTHKLAVKNFRPKNNVWVANY
jgi:hypothetical protein